MTKPKFTDQISLGNVLQMGVLVMAVAAAFLFVKYQSEANAKESEKMSGVLVTLQGRVRSLEVREAAETARVESVQDDIAEIKKGQNENNVLLRQLLRQRQD